MTVALSTVKASLSSVPLFPRALPHPVPFSCPQGHSRSSQDFDVLQSGKAMWCSQCASAHASRKWYCFCGKS
eukprot:11659063-Karenia_brevis.AAC.1